MSVDILFEAIYRGEVVNNHFLDKEGNVYTLKSNGRLYKRKCTKDKDKTYPFFGVTIGGRNVNIRVHRTVCETFHNIPLPGDVTESEWKVTPKSVKECFKHYWEVNHIDNDRTNYHPSNLEWVSRYDNLKKHYEKAMVAKRGKK